MSMVRVLKVIYQVSRSLACWFRRRFHFFFTYSYGHDSHLGHMTRTSLTNFCSFCASMKASYRSEICLSDFCFSEKMFEERERQIDNEGQMIGACLYYKLTYESKGLDVLNTMLCYIYIIVGLSSINIKKNDIVGNPIGKKTLIFTFDGKIEYIILSMLILFLDMWQNTYGWMPSL